MGRAVQGPLKAKTVASKIKRKLYSSEDLKSALEEVKAGKSVYHASKAFKIPESTLRDKISNRYVEGKNSGPQPLLSKVIPHAKGF